MKLLFILAFLSHGLPLLAQGQSGNEPSGLQLTSETDLNSADIHRKEGGATEEEKKEDKKRKSLGIGESVKITLGDKASLMEPINEIQWSIDEGENLLSPVDEKNLKGKTSLSLTVRNDLTKEDVKVGIKISVKVKKEEFSPQPIQFNVILPNKLTAKHIPSGDNAGSPSPVFDSSSGTWLGASAQLKVSVEPTNVNFSNIQIIEKDGGETPPAGTQGSLSGKHNADSVWKINDLHEFDKPDNIGIAIHYDTMSNPDLKFPNIFTFKCNFKTTDGKQTGSGKNININTFETVESVEQIFTINTIIMSSELMLNTKISKFSKPKCTVERTARMHQFYYTDDDK